MAERSLGRDERARCDSCRPAHCCVPRSQSDLTNRDVDSWVRSMSKTIFRKAFSFSLLLFFLFAVFNPDILLSQSPTRRTMKQTLFRWLDPYCALPAALSRRMKDFYSNGGNFEETGGQVFRSHYDRIRRLVPPAQLLEYSVDQGWGPLCAFLDESVPNKPFPKIDSAAEFAERTRSREGRGSSLLMKRILLFIIGPVGVAGAVGYLLLRYPHVFKLGITTRRLG